MRLAITGGGTGGHIYPALEVGRLCAERGWELRYLGSLRGQEGKLCRERGIPFEGFASEPVYSLGTPRGWMALLRLIKASALARKALERERPDVVFSTGGYSSAPVIRAARALKLPYVLHEQNSVPGRSIRMFARDAAAVATTFKQSAEHFAGVKVTRTGMPIRAELREAAAESRERDGRRVLVIGGSQGSKYLNERVPEAAKAMGDPEVCWLHSTGPTHLDSVRQLLAQLGLGGAYRAEPFLDAKAMAAAYLQSSVVVARSGGTLAELALFGLPSVLVPLPSAAGNHQYHNAKEFAEMGAATLQTEDASTPASLANAISGWLESPERRAAAARALKGWDVPDATERIVGLIQEARR